MALNLQPNGIYVDATYGRGGHAAEMLRQSGPQGRLLALDRDPQAVQDARQRFTDDRRFHIVKKPFSKLKKTIEEENLLGQVNGIVFDLGVSLPQLEQPERGFSFRHQGPLDMRMDTDDQLTAAVWINNASEREIADVIRRFGEDKFATRIARAIVRERGDQPLQDTTQLADIIAKAVPTREAGKDPATRTFQAIRMHINRELEELEQALPQTLSVLAPGGRLAVISFHSLEDRIVKRFMRDQAKGDPYPPDLPVRTNQLTPRLKLIGKVQRPSPEEIKLNPRARSAVLRVAERTEQ